MRASPRHKRPFEAMGACPKLADVVPPSSVSIQWCHSQDVDVEIMAGHWKVSSRVQANPFSASFQVARLAGLAWRGGLEGRPAVLNSHYLSTIINVLDTIRIMSLFGRRGGLEEGRLAF